MPGDAVALAILTEQVIPVSVGLIGLAAVGLLLLEAVYLLAFALFVMRWGEEREARHGPPASNARR